MAISSVQNSINSAIINSTAQQTNNNNSASKANSDLLNAALNRNTETTSLSTQGLLAQTASQQISLTGSILNSIGGGDSVTNDLVGLQLYGKNQMATDKLPDKVGNVVGNIIDQLI
ncbi:hypothetical protein [Algibacillus agarilyticus]|uniref:hypothetical protein n=1 Tax=Algibacillus agarilyticus TaxID=2234133 RepID=UPI000DCF78AC|nr:hypothetical protein [Algibacillus agarilyticus]